MSTTCATIPTSRACVHSRRFRSSSGRSMRTWLALCLVVMGCEAPRSVEPSAIPEPEAPTVVEPAPLIAAAPPGDNVLRARIEQDLAGYGYVPDTTALKALGPGTF